jgi:hypothetical protein
MCLAGRGVFGLVYEARDVELNRRVAIKIPSGRVLSTPEDRERFLREARTAASLRHPHIVPVFEIGDTDGQPYIVTEFIDGTTLAESLARSRFSARDAARLVRQLAEAMGAAHARGVVHRDLKPGNILLDSQGEPRITDFGLARLSSEHSTLTTEGQLLGTPAYMAPEQAAGHIDQVDARSDIYSLGVVLYELLTGEQPFRGTPHMVIQQVLSEEPRPPRALDDRIPRDVETICLRAMSKDPRRRFGSAQELAEDLARFLAHEPIRSRRVNRVERIARWCRRKPFVASLLGMIVVLLLSIYGLSIWGYLRETAIREVSDRRRARAEELLGSLVTQADQHDAARVQADRLESEVYRLSIEAAERSLRLGDPKRAWEILARANEPDTSRDWRGWEWFHLHARSEGHDVSRDVPVNVACDAVDSHPDGIQVALGSGPRIIVWNSRDQSIVTEWDARRLTGSPLAWNDDGTRLASVDVEGAVAVWNPMTTEAIARTPGARHRVLALTWSRTGTLTSADVLDGTLHIRDVALPERPATLLKADDDERPVLAVAWSADRRLLSVAHPAGSISVWERSPENTWALRTRLSADGQIPIALAWSPDGSRLVSAGSDGRILCWDRASAQCLVALGDVQEPITSLSWNPAGRRLLGITRSGKLHEWSIRPEQPHETPWPTWWCQAQLAASARDWDGVRRHGRQIREWAGTQADDAWGARERLHALTLTADLLMQCSLFADAIATGLQIVRFDATRVPRGQGESESPASVAARRIDAAVHNLLSAAELSPAARRIELDRLIELLFPYGRHETPIPWQPGAADSLSATWQAPQVVIELASAAGELDRLRTEWDRHPQRDGAPMLALRAEASAAARDFETMHELVEQLARTVRSDPLPLWSEACLLGPGRARLGNMIRGFRDWSIPDHALEQFVHLSADTLHIFVPDQAGDQNRIGVVRREPVAGDFELSMGFDIDELERPDRIAGLNVQLDLLDGGEVLHFSRSRSRDVGDEVIIYQSQVSRTSEFRARIWRFPTHARSGRLILARRGQTMYWLLADGAGPARVIHAQRCPTTDVAAIWLFVDYRASATQGRVDVIARDLLLRSR